MKKNVVVALIAASVLAYCGGDTGGGGITNPPGGGGGGGGGGGTGAVSRVELSNTALTMAPGVSIQLQVRVFDATNHQLENPAVTWTTSAANVATITGTGLVTAMTAGNARITATSGGKSASVDIVVENPRPIITSLDPITVGVNTAVTIRILGTGFMSSSQARLNGSNRPTTFISATELRMAVAAADVPAPTTYSVTVVNPSPGGGPSNAVIFNATAAPPPSSFVCPATPYFFPNVMSGDLGGTDCRLSDGTFFDFYSFTITSQQQVTFSMSSNTMDSYLLAVNNKDEIVAYNDDAQAGTLNSTMRVILPPGTYRIAANTQGANQTGLYTMSGLTTSTTSAQLCNETWVVRGVEIADNISFNDCRSGNFFSDEFVIGLRAGETVTLTMNSTAVTPLLRLFLGSTQVASANSSGGQARIVFTAQTAGDYVIDAGTAAANTAGAYTLSVQ